MTFNFLGPGLTVNVEAKVKEQIILDSSDFSYVVGQKREKPQNALTAVRRTEARLPEPLPPSFARGF